MWTRPRESGKGSLVPVEGGETGGAEVPRTMAESVTYADLRFVKAPLKKRISSHLGQGKGGGGVSWILHPHPLHDPTPAHPTDPHIQLLPWPLFSPPQVQRLTMMGNSPMRMSKCPQPQGEPQAWLPLDQETKLVWRAQGMCVWRGAVSWAGESTAFLGG